MKKYSLWFFVLCATFLYSTIQKNLNAEMRSSITQYGITWTFNGNYECGQFVTGDWWVVGPVTINSVYPNQIPGRHGSCLNPGFGRQGYDDRGIAGTKYSTADRVSYPCTLQPGGSLVSSVSKPETVTDFKNYGNLQSQAVLTIVSSPVAAGTFRPAYCGTYDKYFNISQLQMNNLPNLTPPTSAPSGTEILAMTDRPRIDHIGTWVLQHACAEDNWYNGAGRHACYGEQYSNAMSEAAMFVMLNTSYKNEVINNLVQIGIDNYGVLKASGGWYADGGHMSGRKFLIVFAAVLLNDTEMLQVGSDYNSSKFGEDGETYYGVNGKGLWGADREPSYFLNGCSGTGNKIARDPAGLVDGCSDYRNCCTSYTWVGQMLATLMIKDGKLVWNYGAYFDYVDRWMTGDVPGGGGTSTPFISEMWNTYRNNLPNVGGPVVDVTGVSVSPESLTLDEGLSDQLTQTVTPVDASNKSVIWTSDNTSVATVNALGIVKAIAPGNATITATTNDDGFTDNCSVTVNSIGTNVAFNKSITVSDYDIVSNKPGTNLIDGDVSDDSRWSAAGFPQWAEIDLGADYDLSRIDVFPYENRAYQYIVEGKPQGGSYSTIVNRSTNSESADNLYDNVSVSVRYLKITVNGIYGNTSTWVSLSELKAYSSETPPPTVAVTGVSVLPTSLTLDEGQTSDLTETISPSNATDKSATWSSSNTSIATVDANGWVTAVAEGSSIITVTTNDGGFNATCDVTVNTAPPSPTGGYYCDPVSGSMSNNGSEASPWSTLEAVFAAGETFADGDVIYLMDGNHGHPVITESNTANVTITKYPNHNPVINSIDINGADYWTLNDVTVSANGVAFPNQNVPLEHPVYPLAENALVYITGSDDIIIENCEISSIDDNSVWSTATDWNTKAWNGIMVSGGVNVTITDCHIKNVNFGTNGGCTNFVYRNNLVENFCGDGIQAGSNYSIIEYNTFRDTYNTNGNHDDLLQIYFGTGSGYGIEIRGNKLINYTDSNRPFIGDAQGIAIFDGMHIDYIIENNLVVTDNWHGITILGATNCEVINNTVIDINNTGIGPPWIQIAAAKDGTLSTGNICRNNLCTALSNDANIGVIENNDVISWGEYNSFFADYVNYDFRLAVGSSAIDAGTSTGAPSIDIDGVSRPQGSGYDIGCYEYTGAVINVTGVSVSPTNLTMVIGETSNLTASIEPSNATNKNTIWSSDNPSVASVSSGQITANAEGTATITVTTADGGFTATCLVTINTPSGDYNLALGQPVTDTGNDGNIGANIVDNNLATRWSAEGFPQSATIDLGEECNLSQIEVYTYLDRAYQYTVEASSDGNNYNLIVDRSSNASGLQPISDNVSTTGRYVKITVAGASGYTGTWVSLNEVKVIGNKNVTTPTILIDEDFSTGASDFTVIAGGTWNVSNGRYQLESPANGGTGLLGNMSVHNTEVNGDFELSTLLNITGTTSDWDDVAVIFNYQDANNMYYISLNESNDGNTKGIFKVVNGTATELCDITATIADDTDYTLEVIKTGSDIVVKLGGSQIASATDATFTNGKVGYGSKNDGAQFDDLLVIKPGSSVIPVTNVSVTPISLNLEQGETSDLTETVTPVDATDPSVVWSSDNSVVATVDANGLVTAVSAGSATITVTTTDGGFSADCAVTVTVPVTGVSLSSGSLNLDAGETADLDEIISPANATDKSVVWSSSNTSVATVDANGLVTAVAEGTASITVTTNDGGFTATCPVTINAPAPPQTRNENITGSTNDMEVRSNGGSQWVGQATIRVGGSGSGYDAAMVIPFQLPVLSGDEIILSASLNVNLMNIVNSPGGNVDVYGLPYRSTSSVSTSTDYWQGSYDSDPNATAIQDDFATLSTPEADVITNSVGNSNLADYINAQYAAGAQTGDYIFIRLNPDVANVSDYHYWEFNSANSANTPVLELEIGDDPNKNGSVKTGLAASDNICPSINIRPNPVSEGDIVSVGMNNFRNNDCLSLRIYDITGKTVYVKNAISVRGNISITLNTSGILKKGIYIISVTNGITEQKEKLIIR